MPSTDENGTAAAAAAERHDSFPPAEPSVKTRKVQPESSEDAKKNEAPTKLFCSACGKESNTLKKCDGCKCVWYCDKECQNKHWKEHKKECKVIKKELDKRGGKLDIGTEMDVGPLEKLPQQE